MLAEFRGQLYPRFNIKLGLRLSRPCLCISPEPSDDARLFVFRNPEFPECRAKSIDVEVSCESIFLYVHITFSVPIDQRGYSLAPLAAASTCRSESCPGSSGIGAL